MSKDNYLSHLTRLTLDKAAFGIQKVNNKGNVVKEYFTDPKTNLIKIPTTEDIGGDSSTNGDNGTSGDNIPDSGVNINPGDNLTKLEQLWSGTTDPTSTSEIVLTKDIANIGDGLQIKLNIFKKAVTNGQTADTQQSLTPVASSEPKAQAGKYVLNVPYPISILAKNLVVGKTLNVALDGVGEALATTKVSQAMVMSILVKDSRTLAITCHQGYALDKTTSGNNGAFYTFQATYINSFTIAPKIEQMVNGTELFTGEAQSGEVKLKGVLDGFANVGDGIAVYFSKNFHIDSDVPTSNPPTDIQFDQAFNVSNPLILLKKDLIAGKIIPIKFKMKAQKGIAPGEEDSPIYAILKDNSSLTINSNSLTLVNDSQIVDQLGRYSTPEAFKLIKVTSVTNSQ